MTPMNVKTVLAIVGAIALVILFKPWIFEILSIVPSATTTGGR